MKKIQETHNKLRQILCDNGNEEYGDCIVDEISELFNFPTTTSKEHFKELAEDDDISFNEFFNNLNELDWGDWDSVNSEDVIRQYVSEK